MPNEEELLKNARSFDQDTLGLIYDEYSPGIYRYAMRLLGDSQLAEDCVADTFSRFLKALQFGQGPKEHLKAYLYRISHNWITDSYRRHPFISVDLDDSLALDESQNVDEVVDSGLEQQRVRMALQALTPEQRQVVILRFLEGWNNEQIAEVLEKPIGAVKALQHRALNALRRLLLRDEKESDDGTR